MWIGLAMIGCATRVAVPPNQPTDAAEGAAVDALEEELTPRQILADLEGAVRFGRAVQHRGTDGTVRGMRLYGIRSPEEARDAWNALADSADPVARVELMRRGEVLTHEIPLDVVPPPLPVSP